MLRVFTAEIKPSVREVMEDMTEGTYASRPIDAGIWGVAKQSLDYRIYVTDATGRVLFDSAGLAVGRNFSQWRDHTEDCVRALGAQKPRGRHPGRGRRTGRDGSAQ